MHLVFPTSHLNFSISFLDISVCIAMEASENLTGSNQKLVMTSQKLICVTDTRSFHFAWSRDG